MPIRVGDRVAALLHLEHGQVGYFDDTHRQLLRPLLDLVTPVLAALAAGRAVLQERDRLAESEQRLREEAEASRQSFAHDWSFGRFVGRSPAVRELETRVRQAATAPYPVLLLGETGTGKSILARILHAASPRARQPFVTVFCPSLERSMVEAEMFGHRRGAFTGAVTTASARCRPPSEARCSSTRSATCRSSSSPSCCACSRSARTRRSGTRVSAPPTCA